jgi:DNA-binding response OmpR family regulator/pimeloyl-ACP methyl ester carboxylesterase
MRSRIMVVGRDVGVRARLGRTLSTAGYGVELAENAAHARRIDRKGLALAIVVPEGPGRESEELVEELQAAIGKALLLADAADEAGLLARVTEALRPEVEAEAVEPVLEFAGYRLDLAGRSLVNEAGKEIPLTRNEFGLLEAFAQRPGRVLSRDQLLNALAGREADAYDRSIDMLVVRLRRKIEPDPKRPRLIVTIPGSGYKLAAKVRGAEQVAGPEDVAAPIVLSEPASVQAEQRFAQTIKYCRAPDGVRIAYATSGSGPSLVKSGNWLNHLEYDWESPIWRHVFHGLSRGHTLIRYDARGTGMSDWDVDTLSLDAWVTDLETVVDAVGIERFPLLGISQGSAVAVAYSVRRPERVSHLILYGAFALGGMRRAPAEREMREAMETLMRLGWGANNPSFRQLFTSRFIPDATHEQAEFFNDLQLKTTSPECAARYFNVVNNFDVTDLLSRVRAPTLVMHVRDDQMVPFEAGHQLAAGIPGARFLALPGRNHLFLEHEPASDRFFEEVKLFLGQ